MDGHPAKGVLERPWAPNPVLALLSSWVKWPTTGPATVLMYFQVPAKTPGPGHTAEGCCSRGGRVRANPVPLASSFGQSLAWPVKY